MFIPSNGNELETSLSMGKAASSRTASESERWKEFPMVSYFKAPPRGELSRSE